MTIELKRRIAAEKAFKQACEKEGIKVTAGKWRTKEVTDFFQLPTKDGAPLVQLLTVQYWWRRCHWNHKGKMSGVFEVAFYEGEEEPVVQPIIVD
jgi:hypothetical protein